MVDPKPHDEELVHEVASPDRIAELSTHLLTRDRALLTCLAQGPSTY
jgi:hypothetical protein